MSSSKLVSVSHVPFYLGAVLLCSGLCLRGNRLQLPGSDLAVQPSSVAASVTAPTLRPTAHTAATASGAFVRNQGQWDMASPYVSQMGAMTVFVQERGWTFTLEQKIPAQNKSMRLAGPLPVVDEPDSMGVRGVALRMRFQDRTGSSARSDQPELLPEECLPGIYNYFLGNDPSRWQSDVKGYASLRFVNMYPGVDVRLRKQDKTLEYDLLLEPEADLSQVRLSVEGAESLSLDAEGCLVMHTALGPVRQRPPVTWEMTTTGEKRPLACSYLIYGPKCFGFEVPGWSRDLALVVDPALLFSTFMGGTLGDEGLTVVEDPNTQMVTLTGYAISPTFPTTTGAYSTTLNGTRDAFVSRLVAGGSILVYSTFIGGSTLDYGRALHVNTGGLAWVAGYTDSTDFPTTAGAYDTTHNGGNDWWVLMLTPAGNALLYSTYVGGPGSDSPRTIRVESNGNATVMGVAGAAGFPTTPGAYDVTYNGSSQDAAIIRLNAAGSALIFATYIGGSGVDYALASDLGPNGEVMCTGYASAGDFPSTTGVYDPTWNGAFDAFVTCLHQSGSKLNFSTFLGSTGNDIGYALAVNAKGETIVAGETDGSGGFPTTPGAFQSTFMGSRDVFVAKVDATGSTLQYSTLIGGTAFEGANGLAIALDGSVVVTGDTQSTDYPVTPDAYDGTHNGLQDVFVSRLDSTGKVLLYSTYLGGSALDQGNGISVPASPDVATVTGRTASNTFPTTIGAYDTSHNGGDDVFVTKLSLRPAGITRIGNSTPSCNGDVALYALSDATSPAPNFGLECWKAPPSTIGAFAIALNRLAAPLRFIGVDIWVDPNPTQLLVLLVPSTSTGTFKVPAAIPAGQKGAKVYVQFVWANTAACGGAGTHSSSDALEIIFQ